MYVVHLHCSYGNDHALCKSLHEARTFIQSKTGVTYYDIHSGNSTAYVEGLVEWAGRGGYWANFCDSDFMPRKQILPREQTLLNKAKSREKALAV